MKGFCVILLMAMVTLAISSEIDDQWASYKKTYNKQYDDEEDAKRLEIFKKKLIEFKAHNEKYEKGEVSYTVGINQFTDLTAEEFQMRHTGLKLPEGQD